MRHYDHRLLRDLAYSLTRVPTQRYLDYIRGPNWARIRRWKLESVGYRCEICGQRACQCHHRHYGTLGEELLCDLVAVCVRCHHRLHAELVPMQTVDQLEFDFDALEAANDNEPLKKIERAS